ncbi:ribosome-associated translation inhibitor RaiA [Peptacetobacter hominis]|uniref:Ribosome hibernation promoting factor n=1 Tax=Peptacetobacter hominis TaxID=2743610 RepID=A0A544QWT8_9FIRM|nr:ribosome-associated translation inhibitor RaiA [Peptacetobacter hominis]TQQ85151.1 ribosome-associated translation inhibitor RaiA [Peptacetobacter hominis]
MNIIISGRQMELTQGIKDTVEAKLGRLDKYISPDTDVRVTVSAKKGRHKIEVTIAPKNGPVIRAEEAQDNLYPAIDLVFDKLKIQLRKYKGKMQKKHQENQSIRFESVVSDDILDDVEIEEEDTEIKRRKKISVKPMTEEEAVLQMDLLGHDFYMFKNEETDEIALVYRRRNGGYGIIEQED